MYITRLVSIVILVHFFAITNAQSTLCLLNNAATNDIDFRPDELNNFLHLDKYKIIFFGEQHNDRFDPQIKYHLITDLNKRTGMRHVFLEISFSAAWGLNQYLQTGDTAYLYRSQTNNQYSRLWERLYEYNKELPAHQKIIIHGVDFETTGVFQTLKKLSPAGQSVPLELKPVIDTINAHLPDPPLAMWKMIYGKFTLCDNAAFIGTLRYVQSQFLTYPDVTKTYFGNNYSVVEDIITNNGKVEVKAKHRNSTMFAAMQRIINEQKIDRFIGFFGGQHTTYTVSNSLTNAASGLRGFRKADILNIAEFAYNLHTKDTAFRGKHFHEVVALNGNCKVTVLSADKVPGFKKETDFVIVADISE